MLSDRNQVDVYYTEYFKICGATQKKPAFSGERDDSVGKGTSLQALGCVVDPQAPHDGKTELTPDSHSCFLTST